nr:VOC family protein [FCB group bacterium]
NTVGWFEIPTADFERACAFYEHIFNTKLQIHQMGNDAMGWFPMNEGDCGSHGSLIKCDGFAPCRKGVKIYFSTPDIEAVLAKIGEKGGKIVKAKTSIGEHGFYALIEDTEGNQIGLHSRVDS